jgi:hypothetical protein
MSRRSRHRRSERVLRVLGGTLLLAILLGMGWGGSMLVGRMKIWAKGSEFFAISEWRLTGCERADRERLVAALDALGGHSLVGMNQDSLALYLGQDPWIDRIRVIRDWPNAIEVQVLEARPIALLESAGSRRLLCMDGQTRPLALQQEELPIIRLASGTTDLAVLLESLVGFRVRHPRLFEDLTVMEWSEASTLWLKGSDCRVLLPADRWDHGLSLLEVARRNCVTEWALWRELDLRFTNQLVWRKARA